MTTTGRAADFIEQQAGRIAELEAIEAKWKAWYAANKHRLREEDAA